MIANSQQCRTEEVSVGGQTRTLRAPLSGLQPLNDRPAGRADLALRLGSTAQGIHARDGLRDEA
jgi:hypothetical protein